MEAATDRQQRISWWRQDRLAQAKVAVIGAGALGNEVLKNLALMGLGHLFVFDFDFVETSNLSRTVLFGAEDVGKSKAEVAARSAKALNVFPDATVTGEHVDVVHELGGGLLRRMDVVLGCLDNVEARQAVGVWCYQFSVPYIDGGMSGLGGRVQLHLTGNGACMDCTIGDAERDAAHRRYSCMHILRTSYSSGIIPAVQVTSAFVSALMCQEAIKCLHGQPVRFGHVLRWIGEHNDLEVLWRVPRPGCRQCGVPPVPSIVELSVGADDSVEQLLARVGPGWRVDLPSPFILRLRCGRCGAAQPFFRPSFRCRDADMFCASCRSSRDISIESVEWIGAVQDHGLGSLSLRSLGIPSLATLLGRRGEDLAFFELSKDSSSLGVITPLEIKE
jgi:adenylyltransferase/sulfurtransferase